MSILLKKLRIQKSPEPDKYTHPFILSSYNVLAEQEFNLRGSNGMTRLIICETRKETEWVFFDEEGAPQTAAEVQAELDKR